MRRGSSFPAAAESVRAPRSARRPGHRSSVRTGPPGSSDPGGGARAARVRDAEAVFSAHAREVTRRAAEYCERLIDGAADLHARAQLSAQRVLQSLSLLAQVERRSELRRLEADLRACRPTGRLGAPRSTGAERARDFRGRGSAD